MARTLTADGYRVPPTVLKSTAQDLTANWADLGSEIDTDGYNWMKLFLQVDKNNSLNIRIRVLEKTTDDGAIEYTQVIETVGASDTKLEDHYYELNVDGADQDENIAILIELRNTVPVVQVQVMAGTVGATAGQIDGAHYSLGK